MVFFGMEGRVTVAGAVWVTVAPDADDGEFLFP